MEVTIGKKTKLTCQVCAHDDFEERSAQLQGQAATFFGIEWLTSPSARLIICTRCGYVHWFLPRKPREGGGGS